MMLLIPHLVFSAFTYIHLFSSKYTPSMLLYFYFTLHVYAKPNGILLYLLLQIILHTEMACKK